MKEVLKGFYQAFANKDAEKMVTYYHPEIEFTDPAFGNLKGEHVKNMWRMLIQNGKDLEIKFEVLNADDIKGKVSWIANYTVSRTGRKVENHVTAYFMFKDGLIVKHVDDFDRKAWAKQALGFKGWLIGGTGFFRGQLQKQTKQLLNKFEAAKK